MKFLSINTVFNLACVVTGIFFINTFADSTDLKAASSDSASKATVPVFSEHERNNTQLPESAAAVLHCENATFLAVQLLDQEHRKSDTLSIKYIASLIKLGKYKSAQKEFKSLSEKSSKIVRLVGEVYNESDAKKRVFVLAKKILHFLANLEQDWSSTCELYPPAISVLNGKIGKLSKKAVEGTENEVPSEIFLVSEQFVAANCSRVSPAYSTVSAEEGTRALRAFTIRLLEKWRDAIRREDLEELKKFCRAPKSFKSLKRFLPEIVRNAYGGNKSHFGAVDRFSQELCHSQLSAIAMSALLNEVKKGGGGHSLEMLQLGVSLRKFGWNEGKKFDGNGVTENMFGNLRRGLPQVMGKMIWGSRCAIKNCKTGDYLYAANDNYTDTFMVQKKKYVGSDGGNIGVGTGGWWQFHPWKKEGNGSEASASLYWLIKNMEWERDKPYLCVRITTGSSSKGKRKQDNESNKDKSVRSNSNGQIETCYKTGFNNKKMMMANWVLDPVTKEDGRKVFQFYIVDKDSRRFDLVFEKEPEKKIDTVQQEEEKTDVDKVVDYEDDEINGKSFNHDQLLAKMEGFKLEESYWEIECE